MMNNELVTILIGFFGGVLGGILVNIVSYKLQKREEKKEEEEKYKIEYKRTIKTKLNEISNTWDKELSKNMIEQRKIQNEFDIYSNQLTSIISRAPDEFPEAMLKQLLELSSSLRKINEFNFTMGPENYELFKKECQKITENAKIIRKKLE